MEWETYGALADLPHFNPDEDEEGRPVPPAVADLRARVIAADGWVISSPEYAHGVPGSLKNALDWLVSCPPAPTQAGLLRSAYAARGFYTKIAVVRQASMMSVEGLEEERTR